MTEYAESPTKMVSAANGIDYAFREVGAGDVPLVLLQHFRGNLDNWDPALIDALARGRRVITFDNRGVAASSGTTPSTVAQMALDAIDFIDALAVGGVDLLGFSMGSFVAQEIALVRPSLVQRGARLFGSAGSERNARLGARRDRRSREAGDVG